ncbi:MAG: class I SAM-dependent methyltransferase [Bacteroidia bacterium]|nr:class I SAM-dependent methyltransferase [Bacteroidia bacterium]
MELAIGRAGIRLAYWWFWQRKRASPALQSIFDLYRRLRRADKWTLQVELFGAKARAIGELRSYSLSQLVVRGATPPWKGRLLYELVRSVSPKRILELGTHLGFGTMYLAAAAPQAEIHTIEASPTLATQARRHFRLLGIQPQLHVGLFDQVLPRLAGPWDIVYIDGDHRGAALYQYGTLVCGQLRSGGLLICDDIFWSADMYAGWEALRQACGARHQLVGPLGLLWK